MATHDPSTHATGWEAETGESLGSSKANQPAVFSKAEPSPENYHIGTAWAHTLKTTKRQTETCEL